MKRTLVFLAFVFIVSVLICGCTEKTPSPAATVTPAPTEKTEFSINDPWTDGNLRITILGTREITGRSNTRTFTVSLKLENLGPDKTIHLSAGDFLLLDSDNTVISPAQQPDPRSATYDLGPGQRDETDLDFYLNPDQTGSKIRYDFSWSSGVNGSTVDFNL